MGGCWCFVCTIFKYVSREGDRGCIDDQWDGDMTL